MDMENIVNVRVVLKCSRCGIEWYDYAHNIIRAETEEGVNMNHLNKDLVKRRKCCVACGFLRFEILKITLLSD